MLVAAMIAIAIFFGSFNRYYLSWRNFLDIGRAASLLTVVAIGANLVIVAGEIDLSVGAVVGLVSVAVPAMFDLNLPTPLIVILTMLVGGLAGFFNGFVTLRLLVPSFLATLGSMAIFRGLAIFISNQPREIYDPAFIALFNSSMLGLPVTIIYPLVVTTVVAFFWKYSRLGVSVRAIGSNEQSARFAGLPSRNIKLMVFVSAGIFSALGALLLLGRTQTGLAVAGQGLELNAIAAVIVGGGRLGGGKGSVIGTLLGAVLLTMMFSGIAGMGLDASLQDLTKGFILVIVILLMRK